MTSDTTIIIAEPAEILASELRSFFTGKGFNIIHAHTLKDTLLNCRAKRWTSFSSMQISCKKIAPLSPSSKALKKIFPLLSVPRPTRPNWKAKSGSRGSSFIILNHLGLRIWKWPYPMPFISYPISLGGSHYVARGKD